MTEAGFETMRAAMIDSQLRTSGVADPRIVDAFAGVPREMFVPQAMARVAYVDAPVRVGAGRAMMEPLSLGKLLEAARIGADESVLIVGGATGYSAAVVARLAARVTMVESDAALADAARGTLATLGVDNAVIVEGLPAAGAPQGAPYDALLVDGAVELVPDALLAQLRDGGRIACILIEDGVARAALGVVAGGVAGIDSFAEAPAPVLPGFARAKTFQF